MRSIIYKYSKKELQQFIQTSTSIAEVMKKVGFNSDSGTGRKILFKVISEYNLNDELELLRKRTNLKRKERISFTKRRITYEECFCEKSKILRKDVKNFILRNNLLPYKCSICSNEGFWNNEKLVLQLDHINGINDDNRLENLRFLCPNCHSQTNTYVGRNIHLKKQLCRKKVVPISRENLKQLLKCDTFVNIGKKFNVTDNCIRKWCIKLNLPYKSSSIKAYSDKEWELL